MTLLALAILAPVTLGARLEIVIEDLVRGGRLPEGSRCAKPLGDLPVCLVLRTDADAASLIADTTGAHWERKDDLVILTRSPKEQRALEVLQESRLLRGLDAALAEAAKAVTGAESRPDAYGKELQVRIEEMRRSGRLNPQRLSLPTEVVGKSMFLDAGAPRLARLRMDESLYLSDRRDGVHQQIGREGLRGLEFLTLVRGTPSLVQALDTPEFAWMLQQFEAMTSNGSRPVARLRRFGPRFDLHLSVFSSEGNRVGDFRTALVPPPEPAISLPEGATVVSSALARRIADRFAREQEGSPPADVRALLLDLRRSPTIVLGEDVAQSLAVAYPNRSVGLVLDEGWVQFWLALFGAERTPLQAVFSSIERAGGLELTVREHVVLARPHLFLDAEANARRPGALAAYVRAALVPAASIFAQRSLASRALGSSMRFGSPETLRQLAQASLDRERDNGTFDTDVLGTLAGLLPLPTAQFPVKSSQGAPIENLNMVRAALSNGSFRRSLETPLTPDIRMVGSMYTDAELARMPWELRYVPTVFYSPELQDGKKLYQTRASIETTLASFARQNIGAESLRDYPLFRGEGAVYELRVRVATGSEWIVSLEPRATWTGRPLRVADMPEGEALIQQALRAAPPPALPAFSRTQR